MNDAVNIELNERFKPIIAANVFSPLWDVVKEITSKVIVERASKIPGVEGEIEKQKVAVGKNVLWKYAPFILVGIILTTLIVRFK